MFAERPGPPQRGAAERRNDIVISWSQIAGRALLGAIVGGILAWILTYLDYSYFFTGGVRSLGDQMVPIYIIAILIGAALGALAAAGPLLLAVSATEEPPRS